MEVQGEEEFGPSIGEQEDSQVENEQPNQYLVDDVPIDYDEINPNDRGVEEVSLPSDLDIPNLKNSSKDEENKSEDEQIDTN